MPKGHRSRLQRIERAVRRATELTQALLLLSRAERSGPVDAETTDVVRVVEEIVDSNRPNLGRKRIELRTEIEVPLAVETPSSVVAVALGNRVGNVCK